MKKAIRRLQNKEKEKEKLVSMVFDNTGISRITHARIFGLSDRTFKMLSREAERQLTSELRAVNRPEETPDNHHLFAFSNLKL